MNQQNAENVAASSPLDFVVMPDIGTVTGQQVMDAMISKDITHTDHHNCGICGEMVFYSRHEDQLFFNPGCGCCWSPAEPRDWEEAANWINMQTNAEIKNQIAKRFGLL